MARKRFDSKGTHATFVCFFFVARLLVVLSSPWLGAEKIPSRTHSARHTHTNTCDIYSSLSTLTNSTAKHTHKTTMTTPQSPPPPPPQSPKATLPNQSSSASYTHLDALLKDIPSLSATPISLHLNTLSGAAHTSLSTVNRIMSPLDSVNNMAELADALHDVEKNAANMGIFRKFQVNLPQIQRNGEALDIVLDVQCEELDYHAPHMDLAKLRKGKLNDLHVENGVFWRNLLGAGEKLNVALEGNVRGAHHLSARAHFPFVDAQGVKEVNIDVRTGKENASYNTSTMMAQPRWWWKTDPDVQNYFAQLQLHTVLVGNHNIFWNIKHRFSHANAPLHNTLSYRYFWDRAERNPVTNRREKGSYSQFDCTMATFNSMPDFVRTQFASNVYIPLRVLSTVASLHFNVAGLQPLGTNYSASDFAKVNDKIHPTDRLYTNVRGYNTVGEQKTTTATSTNSAGSLTQRSEPTGGNFAINVEGRLSAPLKMLGMLYDLTKVHGQAFAQAGNVIPLDFEKGDIERAQSNFVQTAKASYGIGFFVLMQNLRFELNYCRKLKVWNQPQQSTDNFSGIQVNVEAEF
uniref:Bacterial surface antigen (D15) domain-containing protein n=1 Tax=Percolomonas cosmopolitus TaxID=63605 RepID=A0A7S1KNJ5_9EUKA|mmetsp:Transcript_2723/g.10454  ORF Transcript_2723/g.10454 Transcript_2723/m.10454 type:complete len:575 (+) Transcript_2723:948-2672(+)